MDWRKIRHFGKNENWGDFERINPILIVKLDNFRDCLESEVIITCGTQGKHLVDSQHYKGNAVDVIAPYSGLHLFDMYLLAEKCGFTGIGLYPEWEFKGIKCGGLHLDVRPTEAVISNRKWFSGPRWIGLKKPDGTNDYLPLTLQNLKATLNV